MADATRFAYVHELSSEGSLVSPPVQCTGQPANGHLFESLVMRTTPQTYIVHDLATKVREATLPLNS